MPAGVVFIEWPGMTEDDIRGHFSQFLQILTCDLNADRSSSPAVLSSDSGHKFRGVDPGEVRTKPVQNLVYAFRSVRLVDHGHADLSDVGAR